MDIRDLSSLFTSNRSERGHSYLGKPNLLSAYLRYFLPWNVFRLCRLLESIPLELKDGDLVFDIGSGPLTLTIALWICRPDLRDMSLRFVCLDRTPAVLEAGKKLFAALAGKNKWEIAAIKGELIKNNFKIKTNGKAVFIHPSKILRGKSAALVTAINVFNEIYWDFSPADSEGQKTITVQAASVLASCAGTNDSRVLVVEPGIPRSGEFITGLRSTLARDGFKIYAPCLHMEACPFPGGMLKGKKAKWCHFPFDTDDAPQKLQKLSDSAGIPKERAVLSFLYAGKIEETEKTGKNPAAKKMPGDSGRQTGALTDAKLPVRILSDPFPAGRLEGPRTLYAGRTLYARYACSVKGAVMVTAPADKINFMYPGDIIKVRLTGRIDEKSGALNGEPEL